MAAPPAKRARKSAQETAVKVESRGQEGLYAPFRALGHVSTAVPFVVQSRSSKFLETPAFTVVTSLGSCWAMWEGASLRLLFIGPDMGASITSLAVSLDSVFAAAGGYVGRYVRGKEVGRFVLAATDRNSGVSARFESDSGMDSGSDSDTSADTETDASDSEREGDDSGKSSDELLSHLTLFGKTLVALASKGTKLVVWDVPEVSNPASQDPLLRESPLQNLAVTPYATIDLPQGFIGSAVLHPASYLNKIIVGSSDGRLAIWNVRTTSLIHTFESATVAAAPSRVTALAQSPAIDVLGVGHANGQCILFDIRMGEALGKVQLDGEGCGEVAQVSFRNDDLSQTLAVASSTGHIALFDLASKMRLLHLVRIAHEGAVGGLEWLSGQPLLMTSGPDNSIKQWLFDSPEAPPRLLKQRSGHHAPPVLVRFYGEDGKSLLTAGSDHALRMTSVVRDSRGHELSQGSVMRKANHLGVRPSALKLPSIRRMAFSQSRAKDWDNVLTLSETERVGRTWSVDNKRIGKWSLETQGGAVTAVEVTACGNFGLVGSDAGEVTMYNLQSGLKRKNFALPQTAEGDSAGRHVTGVATDALNRLVVVPTLKGFVHFFDFHTMKLLSSLHLPAGVTASLLNRESGLVAVSCDDLVIRLVDIETLRVVRELSGFRGTILDIAFSPDSRWLIAASQDSIIRTFDLPTGHLIDAFRTATVATSLAFSPTADFLVTSHVGNLGVFLWANRAQFSDVSLRSFVEQDLESQQLPTVQGVEVSEALTALEAPVKWEDIPAYTTPEQLSDELLTLSLMPRSRWQTLLHLDTIKQRNKSKEAPKAPERAPFFLPTLPGVKQRFDLASAAIAAPNPAKSTRKLGAAQTGIDTDFVARLKDAESTASCLAARSIHSFLLVDQRFKPDQAFFEYLKALSPSATDLEIRTLSSLAHLQAFLRALSIRLRTHKDFEAVQTYLACFLRIHGDIIVANPELAEALDEVMAEQARESGRLMDLTHYALGTLAFLRSTPIA